MSLLLAETWCGDCLELLPKVAARSVDMILCDLPYGITSNKWDSEIPLSWLWPLYKSCLKKNGVVVLTASQPFTSTLVQSNLPWFRHEWIWIKNRGSNFANTVREPFKEHESILVFSEGKWTYNKQMQERTGGGADRVKYGVDCKTESENYRKFDRSGHRKLPELRVPSSWQKFNTEVGLHPTQKPVPLFEYLIRTYTNEEETVLDSCCGSGTTGVSCRNTNRGFIQMDISPEYCDIARKRLSSQVDTPRTQILASTPQDSMEEEL